ncbi:MAG TPA: prepilin peptidase [Lachnospiraceae bacterium]|nr:prepilin peptidase [Lachnospiraceae bacterium]
MMQYIGLIGVLLLLVICTIEDCKNKKIVTWHLLVTLPFLCLDLWFNPEVTLLSRLCGIVIGGIFLLLSKLTKEQIGVGDAYIIIAIGLMLGGFSCLEVITYSFFISSIVAIILMIIFRFSRKKTIPFVPFLLLGFICSVVLGGIAR